MTLDEVYEMIGDKIVEGARSNLQRMKKNASRNLSNSLKYVVDRETLSFEMAEYGKYVDQGVNGQKKNNGSKYSYASGPLRSSNGKFIKSLQQWCRLKGMDMSAAYAIRAAIIKRGQKPTFFFTKSFDYYMEKDMDDLIDEYVDSLFLGIEGEGI